MSFFTLCLTLWFGFFGPLVNQAQATPTPGVGTGVRNAAGSAVPLGKIIPATEAYNAGSDTSTGVITNFELLISNMIGIFTIVAGLAFLVYFFLGAFNWVTSAGDKGKLEKARGYMVDGAIGMVIVVASYSAIGLIGSVIGFDLLSPGHEIMKLVPGSGTI